MKKVISILLAIAMLSCFMVTVVSASNTTGAATVKVANVSVEKGQNATVSVSIANNPGYRSYAMALKYDASKLEVVSVSSNVTSNTKNAGVVYVSFASATLVEGDGQMFSVTFKTKHDCKASAAVKVEVEELFTKGANNAAEKIPYTTSNGAVTVEHVAKTVAGKAAKCTEDGLTEGSVCSVCGKTLKTQVKIDALRHIFNKYVSNNDATCVKNGTKTAKCDRCEATHTIEDENSALGHIFTKYVSNNDALCEKNGTKTAKCDRCEATHTIEDEDSALGHAFHDWYIYDEVQHWHVCSRCAVESTKENHVHNIKMDDKLFCVCGHSIPDSTEPTEPDVSDPSTPAPDDDDEPETGDITGLIVFGFVAVVAMAGAVAYTVKRKFAK